MIGCLLALVCAVSEPAFPARDFTITDYGAKPGEKCTAAFDAAFAACERAGGGRVVVPKGTWLTGGVRFRSNCNLHLSEGSTVEFTDDIEDRLPAVHTSWEGVECLNYSPLVYAYGVTNVALTGGGTLAPRMDRWRTWYARPSSHMAATELLYHWCSTNAPMAARDLTKVPGSMMRPHLVQFNRAKGVLLDGFRIRESPFWTIHLYHSENCIVRNLDVRAHGHNNDGVDVEMTKDVLIENCRFDQGDDGVVLKAGRNRDAWRLDRPTENVEVRNCTLVNGHTLLGIGSELSGGIRNVHLSDCTVSDVYRLVFVKTNRRRGGFVENVTVENVTADSAWRVFGLDTDVVYQWKRFPDYELRMTRIDGITMRNIRCKRSADIEPAFDVLGDLRLPPRNLKFENVSLGEVDGELFRVKNAEGVVFENVRSVAHAVPTSTVDRVLAEVRAWDLETDDAWRRLTGRADYDNHRRQLLGRVLRSIGEFPERTPLNAQVTGTVRLDGLRVEKVMFESRPHYHVTGHLFLPDSPRFRPPYRPVLVVCGHSEGGKMSAMYQYGAATCAKAGFATFIIDPVDQGERWQFGAEKRLITTRGHNHAGARAALLGEEFAVWRAWDAMRAIDYLYGREDVRRDGIGVMGNSGGGTMTSWMRVFDDRVTATASACYISTLRDVCAAIGPQDAEQQIYGELKLGLNHAGMQLVRDTPGLLCCKHRDFFPFGFPYAGSTSTFRLMKEVAGRVGALDNWAMCDADGPHGWVPSTIAGSVLWMRGHLAGERGALPLDVPALRALDAEKVPDSGMWNRADANVTPTGLVLDLPGEKTIYELLDEKLAALEKSRKPLKDEELAACVRCRAGIRLPESAAAEPSVPFDLYRPAAETAAPVLIVADRGRKDAEVMKRVEAAKAAGSVVMVADVAGFGELGAMRNVFYAAASRPEEGTAVMLYLLGESLVGRRATDVLACAAYLKRLAGRPVTLVAARTAVIPSAHAFAAERAFFDAVELTERPLSWSEQLRGRGPLWYSDCVFGALRAYDWTDCVKSAKDF